MKQKITIIFFAMLFFINNVNGQYTLSSCGSSTMLLSNGAFAVNGDDNMSGQIPLPFSFTFYNSVYSSVYVSTNGFISFNGGGSGCCSGYSLPNSEGQAYVALAHTDLNPDESGSIFYGTIGTAPNRVFVIHYQNVAEYNGSGSITGEIQLFETTNELRIVNSLIDLTSSTTTVGIAKGDGIASHIVSGRNAVNGLGASNECWSFIPGTGSTESIISGTTSICNGDSAAISVAITAGLPPYTVVYTDGISNTSVSNYVSGSTIVVSPTVNTNYTLVSVTDSNSIAGTGNSGSASVTVIANVSYYLDADNDGYGNPNVSILSCTGAPVGYVIYNTDCNDSNDAINPDAVDVCYDGIDNDCNGIIDNLCTPIVSLVQTAQCGQTLANIDDYVYANLVAGAQGYRFKVTNMVTNEVQTIDRFLRVFRITQLPNYAFNTEYQVEVAVRKFNVWQPSYGVPCTIKTPATTTQLTSPVINLSALTDIIYANLVPFATGYRFKITNASNPADTQIINRSLREFRMSLLAGIAYDNMTYNVQVAIRNTDGITYLPYGPICTVTTPVFPSTFLQSSQCDEYAVPNNATILYAEPFTGAQGYRFRFQNLGEGYTQEVDRNLRTVRLSDFTGLTPGATYSVFVALKINGVWGSFTGKSCSIKVPGSTTRMDEATVVDKGNFAAVAYPNPFATMFAINVQTDSQEMIQLKVYDMLGRLVEQKETTANDKEATMFGERYPSGVYSVIVTQGSVTETLRVVKR